MSLELFINIGRFHPLLVHLPIGILLFAVLLEGMKRWKKDGALDTAIGLALPAGALFAAASVLTGLLLSGEGGYDETLLARHKWLGIAMAGCAILLYFAHSGRFNVLSRWYTPLLVLASGLLVLTGHYGGNLTHGADYLFSRPDDGAIVIADIETANAFETVITPILEEKCNGCHNPSKAKGELVMTTRDGLLAGGKNGPVFNPDQPQESEFLKRIHLPEPEKKHMPPKGKKQLSEEEVRLLEWWVKNGACFDCIVQNMEERDSVQSILDKYTTASTNLAAIRADAVDAGALAKLNAEGLRVYPIAEGSPLLIANLSNHRELDNRTLAKLKKIRRNVVELDLSHSNFSDELSGILRKFPNLNKLQLQRTAAGDKAISQLEGLKYLESLNIYGTQVADASIGRLQAMPALRYLYSWRSAISEAGIRQLQEARPLLEVQHQLDESLFGESRLNPPAIVADSELFTDSVVITLVSNFRNTSFYYTLDGSDPDTCSMLYADSLVARETARLKALAYKAGWEVSPVAERMFCKAGIKAKKALLAEPPNEKYKGNGAATLVDLEKGTAVFTDGNWLGYEGQHMTATIEMEKEEQLQEVVVSALSAPGSWIFFPAGLRVWLSRDGRNYHLAGELELPKEEPGAGTETKYIRLAFGPERVKYLKVQAISQLKNPEWHPNPGEKCWIFIDEVLLN